MKRIAAIALSAVIAGSTLVVGQTNVSVRMDLGGASVGISHTTGHRPPPPPPRRVVHYVDYGWDGPSHHYGKKHAKKLKKRYKEYRKAQKKYYKEVYKHHKRHGHHHDD